MTDESKINDFIKSYGLFTWGDFWSVVMTAAALLGWIFFITGVIILIVYLF